AIARDIHVDNLDGDNAFTGWNARNTSDASGPVRTIARALDLAAAGDRIVLKNTGEPYRESVSLMGRRHSGYSFGWFTIEGNGSVLDGSASVPLEAWEHYRGPVFRFRPPRLAHQQLFLNDRPALEVPAARDAKEPPELESLEWCLHGGHIYFSIEPNTPKLPQDYALTYTHHKAGISLYHVERVVVKDLTIQGFQLDGISLVNSARDVSVVGVTCRGNARNGITVGGASRALIDGCLLGNNGAAQLLTLPWSETGVQNSELLSNTAPAWVDRGGKVYIDGQRVVGGLDEPAGETPGEAAAQ
ncbi:MAG: right-handed parallel beta-helix repeat-containing protein, partial [Planctomycetes bacterium]|nr:right-handed parallel beta-helix repeat-containing protein [Planctomycetota bacterium]